MSWRKVFVPIIAIIIFALLWELLVYVKGWPNYKMASPSDIGPAFWEYRWLFVDYGWDTLWRTVAGLLLAILVGLFLGMVMGFSKTLQFLKRRLFRSSR